MPKKARTEIGDNPAVAIAQARERDLATREILQVISRSRDDEKPVFDVILENACRLCDAPQAFLLLASDGRTRLDLVAYSGTRSDFVKVLHESPLPLDASVAESARSVLEQTVIHTHDLMKGKLYQEGQHHRVRAVEVEGVRTRLLVPLISGGQGIGAMNLYRREVKPFAENEIELVQTFAEQAVIAIDNVRQYKELETRNHDLTEALERQTATSEVLNVISRSQSNLQPVLDTIARTAVRLCQAENAAIWRLNDGCFYLGAHTSTDAGYVRRFEENPIPAGDGSVAGRAVEERRPVHVDDVQSDPVLKNLDLAERSKTRTMLAVPLFAPDGEPKGAISLLHRVVKPFTPEQIALVETFADQAAIAIENVRLFRELQTRLEREKATREILEVISRSRDNEKPVFDVILKNSAQLCHAPLANLNMLDETGTNLVLLNDWGEPLKSIRPGHKWSLESELVIVRAVREGHVIHIRDLADDELYRRGDPIRVRVVDEEGVRTFLAVPLMSGDRAIGAIGLFRREVSAFTDSEIDLVKTFAAQAVIAIDNVKQFKALEARTKEVEALNIDLENRVAVQVGELERLGRLKRFLSPQVADAVVSSGDESLLSSHRALIAVLFCDIRGFTAFCEMAEPEETIEVLQTYHEEMGNLINAHSAGVDHRSGDGIMVIFNDPLPCDDPAGDALRMALMMRERMAILCKDWRRLGYKLGFGVGISLGYATVGMVGSEGRYDYTASGTAVNLAARICDEATDGEILLSPRAYAAVGDEFGAESAGELSLKGIHAPVEVFRVISN